MLLTSALPNGKLKEMDKKKQKEIERQLHEEALKKLEAYMLKHRIQQYKLAQFLGTTEANVSRWFTRKHIMGSAWRQLVDLKLKE